MAGNVRSTGTIQFRVNGKDYVVPADMPVTTSLNDFLREKAALSGTKVMCRQAGCGCCTVVATHASLGHEDLMDTHSVMSCVVPLYSVDGWQITTVEGIGNHKAGLHPIQERIASYNGSQCGYCIPGIVMNMYGLLHQTNELTPQEIEDSFDGHICRCTGYRPILDALKTFAHGTPHSPTGRVDIEDLDKHLCPKTGHSCVIGDGGGQRCLNLDLGDVKWYRPNSLGDIDHIINCHKNSSIRFIHGNTSRGIYQNDGGPFDVYIDTHRVKEIFLCQDSEAGMALGGGHSLTHVISLLETRQDTQGYGYFLHLVKHFKKVANISVRNTGSIAGNLMIKHGHPEFPSDLFTTLEAAGATVQVHRPGNSQQEWLTLNLSDFLDYDMKYKVLTCVHFPRHTDNQVYRSFKVAPRWQNAHGYINAAFRFRVEGDDTLARPSIVYGGINAITIHAEKTETFLEGKCLDKNVVLLTVYKPNNPRLTSGQDNLLRPISSGLQTYQHKMSEFPLKQAMPKMESYLQTSGETLYVDDMPRYNNELFVAFVQSDVANATLESIDVTLAMEMPGVVGYVDAKDISRSDNNNTMPSGPINFCREELFASKEICFNGQIVGAIIAERQDQATEAASKVKIIYSEIRKPILSIENSIDAGKEFPFSNKELLVGQPDEAMESADKIISGEVRMNTPTHFFMEPHVAMAVPSENGMDVYSSTQYPDLCQTVAANIIDKPLNFINLIVPRLGGGFGGKLFDASTACGVATLCAHLTGRPVWVVYSLSNVMTICGRRPPILAHYKTAVNDDGRIQAIHLEYYLDMGYTSSLVDNLTNHSIHRVDMGYHVPHWKIHAHPMMTNKPRAAPMRAPGGVPAGLVIESIMEHTAMSCNMHPILLKEINLIDKHQTDYLGHPMQDSTQRECWYRLKNVADVETRMNGVDAFNKTNRWKKRGLTMTTSKYGIGYNSRGHSVHVSIFHRDGSVVVSQGGVEMGQGLHMKVAQAVARVLDIEVNTIKVRPGHSIVSPNAWYSGGSTSSELAVKSATEASKILVDRIKPIKDRYPGLGWKQLIGKCESCQIDLSARYQYFPPKWDHVFRYFTYSVAAVETEVDVLTGESQIRRVDIMADLGDSLNPTIDIGQIEGGFVMGLGTYLSEDTVIDDVTGRIVNTGTWDYKPPTTKDIPIDWRIHLLPDRPNPLGVHGSKAVGEPPVSLACGALFATKLAVQAAQRDLMGTDDVIPTVSPYTVERIHQSIGLDIRHLQV